MQAYRSGRLHSARRQRLALLGLFLLLFAATGCVQAMTPAQTARAVKPQLMAPPPPQPSLAKEATSLHDMIGEMADVLTTHLEDPDPSVGELADGLVSMSFVELKKLSRTSSFGRYLAEQLMTEFQQRGYTVSDVRKTTEILVEEKRGEYGLSRDAKTINPQVNAGAMLTGTYTLAGDQVLINAKILDNRDTRLLAAATVLMPRTRLVDILLADSASATAALGESDVVYMKRLEL